MFPNIANYGAIEIRAEEFSRQTVFSTGHIHTPPGYPATRNPLEPGKYYTFEFDLVQDPKYDYRFDVIYFNIVEDPSPAN